MAKIDLKFLDLVCNDDYIRVCQSYYKDELSQRFKQKIKVIDIQGEFEGKEFLITFDISTAIKFAKTLRTEINKAKEEGSNG